MNQTNQKLRTELKAQRRNLTDSFKVSAAENIAVRLCKLRGLQRANSIAVYMAFGGEVDCLPFMKSAILRKKRIFLPILIGKKMCFAPLKSSLKMNRNRFGVLEPVYRKSDLIAPRDLDVVIAPLVAFDEDCNRLGMGGGFYDRCFAFRKHRSIWRKPLLVGVAYDFQQADQLHTQPWDVPLDAVVTEKECYGSC
jgi:5-formyltetrahydrofolate cyclo-ligase